MHAAGICIFSQPHEFALIRKLDDSEAGAAPDGIPALAFAADGSRAARYFSPRKLCTFRLPNFSFETELYPFSTACRSIVITAFSFSAAADALVVCGSDSRMRIFNLQVEVSVPTTALPLTVDVPAA